LSALPVQRWGASLKICRAAVIFLAAPASDFMHGHITLADGGWMAC
jgi:2-deoxy-D-gluconate 3-dehydrogenase